MGVLTSLRRREKKRVCNLVDIPDGGKKTVDEEGERIEEEKSRRENV